MVRCFLFFLFNVCLISNLVLFKLFPINAPNSVRFDIILQNYWMNESSFNFNWAFTQPNMKHILIRFNLLIMCTHYTHKIFTINTRIFFNRKFIVSLEQLEPFSALTIVINKIIHKHLIQIDDDLNDSDHGAKFLN